MKHLKAEDYLSNFNSNNNNIKELCKIALETRKFEIDLYWKRATYFWAFIAASFAGYFAVLSSNNINNYRIVTVLIAGIGFCFSLGWYFVNRGSKFWQENWEAHVSKLEIQEQGPLFSSVKIPEDKFTKWNGHYSFSVSKVNQVLSMITTLIWTIMFIGSVLYTLNKTNDLHIMMEQYSKELNVYCIIIISLVVLFLFGLFIYRKTLAFTQNEFCYKTKDTFFLNTDISNISSEDTVMMGNDEFILYIRKKELFCEISTKELGKLIWLWIKQHDPDAIQIEKDRDCHWETKNISEKGLPKTATQFKFNRSLLPELYSFLDDLSQSDK